MIAPEKVKGLHQLLVSAGQATFKDGTVVEGKPGETLKVTHKLQGGALITASFAYANLEAAYAYATGQDECESRRAPRPHPQPSGDPEKYGKAPF